MYLGNSELVDNPDYQVPQYLMYVPGMYVFERYMCT